MMYDHENMKIDEDDNDDEKSSDSTISAQPQTLPNQHPQLINPGTPQTSTPSLSLLTQITLTKSYGNEFPYLRLYDSQFIILEILSYLNANDLFHLSCTSKSFYYSTSKPVLWCNLLLLDFMFDEQEKQRIYDISTRTTSPLRTNSSTYHPQLRDNQLSVENNETNYLKNYYMKQIKEVQIRIKSAKDTKLQIESEQRLERRVQYVESFLDITSIRIYLPLPAASIFSTLLLIALRVDGRLLPVWVCLSPILFFLLYTLFVSLVTYATYQYRHHSSPLIRALWTNFRGPIHYFYTQITQESSSAARIALSACVLTIIQIIFFGLKTSRSVGQSFHEDFDWGIVFLPIWILFCLYLTIPFLECARGNLGPFFVIFGMIWIPLFILFVILTIKLNGIDEHNHDRHIKISLMLIPFWILEGLIMIVGFVALVNGIHRYRKGFLDRENFLERVVIFSVFWSFLSPIVIFQSFLSARDDEKSGDQTVTMADTLSPILFMIAFALCCTFLLSVKIKTPFQESRHQREMQAAGTRNLFEV